MGRRELAYHMIMLRAWSLVVLALTPAAHAQDFSGTWLLDAAASGLSGLPVAPQARLVVTHDSGKVTCPACGPGGWVFTTDRRTAESTGAGHRNSIAAKWQGDALVLNVIVVPSGRPQYVLMDHWRMSRDQTRLTIRRTPQNGEESTLVYLREGTLPEADPAPPPPSGGRAEGPAETGAATPPPPAAEPEQEHVLEAGARLPLRSMSSFNSKTAQEGERVYLETIQPVSRFGRLLLPVGTQVTAAITFVKPAGRVRGRGEMMLRFETLITPGGVTKDFRAGASGADADTGRVDKEGKIKAGSDKAGDAGKIGTTTATGAVIGASVGGVTGLGIGAAAGAAAGLARVLGGRGPDVTVRRGDVIEMSLDREVRFAAKEVR
jgi:type IV secretion system protein VirB10